MKKIINAPENYVDEMLQGIYAAHGDQVKYVNDDLRCYRTANKKDGKVAIIEGVEKLSGARVQACDLRAGAAMVIAGLSAQGVTEIDAIHHIERGYEKITERLSSLGADISYKR